MTPNQPPPTAATQRVAEPPSAPWTIRRKILAYALLSALAAFSIWYIDRNVRQIDQTAIRIPR